ncbi:unnamed protein product [Allacma fusca]|uniref:Phosphoglycerate mutase n=1 Tax=Allacma fusca TaxID=39272 RepID=A0A8J2LJ98_9HEXA|nr:unnamed protein product [Allacma fusca]
MERTPEDEVGSGEEGILDLWRAAITFGIILTMVRRIVIVRHGERVDHVFGMNDWLDLAFDNQGRYRKINLNMPDGLPIRAGAPRSFYKDGPLTQVGVLQGQLVGKGLLEESILRPGFEVFVSPAYRSIQTATAMLEGMKSNSLLKIEPYLFEWTGWYSEGIPSFLTTPELLANGFKNIDTSYNPVTKMSDLVVDEEVANYYTRTYDLVNRLIASTDNDLLLVAHGSTLEVGTRQLLGHPPRTTHKDMLQTLFAVPYGGVAVVELDEEVNKWKIIKNGKISISHSAVSNFCSHKNFVERDINYLK